MGSGIHRAADAPLRWIDSLGKRLNRATLVRCHDCKAQGDWTFLEKEVIYPAPDTVSHSLTIKFNHEQELVLLVAHCDTCGIEEEFWGELPRVEKGEPHGASHLLRGGKGEPRLYARVERIAIQHERARDGRAPLLMVGAYGLTGHILHRGI